MTADRKISELPVAGTLDGTEMVPVVQGGDNVRTTIALFASGGSVVATGGTTARTLANHFGDVLNAKDFGAVGDNVADDTAALNAFFAAIRAAITTTVIADNATTIRGIIPPGVYKCGNVNATNISAFNWVLECSGAILNGTVAGKPVLDMIGSRWFTVKDLTILGNSANKPTFGLQHGRKVSGNATGEVAFLNCKIDGHFSKAAYVNLGAETVTLLHPTFFNRASDAGAYVAALDGWHTLGVVSDFATITIPANSNVGSFLQSTWINCDLRRLTTGKCLLISGNVGQHYFYNGYMVSYDSAAVYIANATEIRGIYLDVHFETAGLTSCLLIDNTTPASAVIITDLYLKDHAPQCSNSIINVTGTTQTVAFDGCQVHVGRSTNSVPIIGTAGGSVNKFIFSGKISWHHTTVGLNLSNMVFTGDVEVLDTSTATVTHGVGSYRIIRRGTLAADRTLEYKGYVRSFGDTSATPANYLEMRGSVAASPVGLIADGTDTNIDISIAPKGTGNVKFGTIVATGDVAIVGSVSIKTADGTVRKLAVIA